MVTQARTLLAVAVDGACGGEPFTVVEEAQREGVPCPKAVSDCRLQ